MQNNTNLGNSTYTNFWDPVLLDPSWGRLRRLISIVILATLGCIGNIFLISSILAEKRLRKAANSIIVCIGAVDLLISGVVFPISVVVLLAGVTPLPELCPTQWFCAILAYLICTSSMLVMSLESCARLWYPSTPHGRNPLPLTPTLSPRLAAAVVALVWILCIMCASIMTFTSIGFDYCKRLHSGNVSYQLLILAVFVLFPTIVTCLAYARALIRASILRKKISFKPSMKYNYEYGVMVSNIACLVVFIGMWSPFWYVLSDIFYHPASFDMTSIYNVVWFGLARSCFNPYVYCFTNEHFRDSFVRLFNYCCCKMSVNFARHPRNRHHRELRVHMLQTRSPPRIV